MELDDINANILLYLLSKSDIVCFIFVFLQMKKCEASHMAYDYFVAVGK